MMDLYIELYKCIRWERKVKYCYFCMKQMEQDRLVCPHCNKDEKDYNENLRHIKPGSILDGKYLIGHVLGEGGFGITYVGLDLNLNLKVAIKEYFPVSLATRDVHSITGDALQIMGGDAALRFRTYRERYEKEGNMLARLDDCSGIVEVLNFFSANNTSYMVMEYIDNTLEKYLKRNGGRISEDTVKELFKPVLRSMIKVHELGIIHKDISPDNIMMSSDGRIKIIDFGASEDSSDSTEDKFVVLKRYFAPPEQYQANANLGPAADVYALCATMYVCLTGKRLTESIDRYFEDDESDLDNLKGIASDDFIASMRYGLKPDVRKRCKSIDELYECIYGESKAPVEESPEYLPEKNYKGLQITIVLLFFITVIVIGFIYVFNNHMFNKSINVSGDGGVISSSEIIDTDEGNLNGNENINVIDNIEKNQTVNNENTKVIQETDTDQETSNTATVEDTAKDINLMQTAAEYFTYEEYVSSTGEEGIRILALDQEALIGNELSTVNGQKVEVVVPSHIDGKPVLAIAGLNSNVTSVYLCEGIKRIDNNAFKNYFYLERLYLPNSLKEIGKSAFDNCVTLGEIIIGDEVYTYDNENKAIVDENSEAIIKLK